MLLVKLVSLVSLVLSLSAIISISSESAVFIIHSILAVQYPYYRHIFSYILIGMCLDFSLPSPLL